MRDEAGRLNSGDAMNGRRELAEARAIGRAARAAFFAGVLAGFIGTIFIIAVAFVVLTGAAR